MNEIIATIITGLPSTAIFFGWVGVILLYVYIIAWACINNHNWMATFMIAIPLFLFISFVSYQFGIIV